MLALASYLDFDIVDLMPSDAAARLVPVDRIVWFAMVASVAKAADVEIPVLSRLTVWLLVLITDEATCSTPICMSRRMNSKIIFRRDRLAPEKEEQNSRFECDERHLGGIRSLPPVIPKFNKMSTSGFCLLCCTSILFK